MTETNPKGTVLIVEDDLLLALVEDRLVVKLGYQVVGNAVHGEEAVEKVKLYDPDVVIMDISLKGSIDGIEAVHQIREFSDVPVIYLSGNAEKRTMERARKTNFLIFLLKPISANQLVGPLKKAMKQQRKHASPEVFNQAG